MLENAPGLEKYIPTRLDWLLVLLNARFQIEHPFRLYFKTGNDGKSICVVVSHSTDIDKRLVEEWIHRAKDVVLEVAASYGWDSWLEVKVDIHEKAQVAKDSLISEQIRLFTLVTSALTELYSSAQSLERAMNRITTNPQSANPFLRITKNDIPF